jgi:phage baseplate assembly protein W
MQLDPYGSGIVCPFQRDAKGDFAHDGGLRVLRSDISELIGILGPTATQPGELAWRADLGTNLHSLRHRKLHSELVRATAEAMIGGALRTFEDRVRVGPTRVSTSASTSTLTVRQTVTPLGVRPEQPTEVTFLIEE